ncbi:SIR2 family NAD-dependent protein deacylase [Methanosarcina sp. Mfa9]|uniref:SIR2 family NAD-dependent protein deacylase n=1 Tax=Methanosarcina sp. Mfa9 TaxID=3439063 RepID=UPI003F840A56
MDGSRFITEAEAQKIDIDPLERLTSILQNDNPILMVGAGSSRIVGYPGWYKLIEELNKLTPSLQYNQNENPLTHAGKIKNQLECEGKIKIYHNFLKNTFEPKGKGYDKFHQSLFKLGFSGIVTTNYDNVLELAAYDNYGWCESIDLCSRDHQYKVLDFLRSISKSKVRKSILHLHGYFENPRKIILTKNDYLTAYGEIKPDGQQVEHDQILHTFHRKVIWSLLATHPLVFIGFSMSDEFFMNMLKIVKKDFDIDSDPIHYAIISNEDNEEDKLKNLKLAGVFPLFYPHNCDHRGLQNLIFEIEHLIENNSDSHDEIQYHDNEELSTVVDIFQDSSTGNDSNQFNSKVSQVDSINLDEINKKMLEL